MKLRNSFY